jgi:hypothetical protein
MALHAGLQKVMALTNADRQHVLDCVHGITQTQSEFKVTAGAWSVGEVLHHLMLVEVSISKLFNKLIRENQRVVGATDAVRVEDMVYPSDRRAQAPEFAIPAPQRPITASLAELAAVRERTKQTLAGFSGGDPSELRWQHPVFGDIGLAHWVRFIGLHEAHHAQQIERIMAAPGLPR